MDWPNPSHPKTGRWKWWLKAKVAFDFKEGLFRRKSAIERSQTMNSSAQQPSPKPSTVADVRPKAATRLEPHEREDPRPPPMAIEAEPDLESPVMNPRLVPIIEIDMTPDVVTTALVSARRNVVRQGQDEALRRYQTARATFERYNLPFDESSWDMYPKAQVERINKSPRMRVHYTCHQCRTSFGHDKTCLQCAHERCKKCPRHPPRRKKSRILKEPVAPVPNPAPEVQNGTCHECQTPFDLGLEVCGNCQHQICERCIEETVATAQQSLSGLADAIT